MDSNDPFVAAIAERRRAVDKQADGGRSAAERRITAAEGVRSRVLVPAMASVAERLRGADAWWSGPEVCIGVSGAWAVKGSISLPVAGAPAGPQVEVSVSTDLVGNRCVNWVIVGAAMRNYEFDSADLETRPAETDSGLREWVDGTLEVLILDEVRRGSR